MAGEPRRRLTWQEMAERQELADARALLGNLAFRNFMLRFFAKARIFSASAGAPAHVLASEAGRRALGLEVFNLLLNADPSALALLITSPEDMAMAGLGKKQRAPEVQDEDRTAGDAPDQDPHDPDG